MRGSAGISGSAGSSAADCCALDCWGVSAPENPTRGSAPTPDSGGAREGRLRVDFYVLEQTSSAARLQLACRLAEKAWLAGCGVLVWHTDRAELASFDELLWTFADGSFVAHEWLTSNPGEPQAPVWLSADESPQTDIDVVIDLADEPPPFLARVRRLIEVLDGDEARRSAGRARFKRYRELGLEPNFHALRSG